MVGRRSEGRQRASVLQSEPCPFPCDNLPIWQGKRGRRLNARPYFLSLIVYAINGLYSDSRTFDV